VETAQKTFQMIYPKLSEFRKAKEPVDVSSARAKKESLEKLKRQKVKSSSPELSSSVKVFAGRLSPDLQDIMDLDGPDAD
jgi:hypothetical protein